MASIGLVVLCFFSFDADAATPGETELIRERQDRLLDEQRRRLEELKELPGESTAPAAPAVPVESRCFPIESIELEGADTLSNGDKNRLLRPYLKQCLGVAQLNELLKVITHHYIDTGQLTSRAYLPQQDLSAGHLTVRVVEGRIEGLTGAEGSRLTERELAMTFPGKTGDLLNLREIEQMVDQLNRLPSNRAQMELAPGRTVGGSEIHVNNAPLKPWRAGLSRSNDGQRSTGEQQWRTTLEWDSPLGLADQLMLRGGHDAMTDSQHTSNNAMLYYNLPWGWWNFSYLYSQSEYRSDVAANGYEFKQTGDSENHQMRAERVIHRDSQSKTSLSAGVSYLRTSNFIGDSKLKNSSNRLTELQYGFNHGRRIGYAFVNLDLGLQQGIGAFDAQANHDPRGAMPDARYRKYTATATYLHPFRWWGESFSFTSLMTGQRSEDVLFSPQRISLGGQSSIRGYKDQSLAGDSGGYWRNDLRWSRPVTLEWLRPAFAEYGASVGYDQGVIRGDHYNKGRHGRLTSNSMELFAQGEHLGASVTFANSLERPAALTKREAPIYFRLDFFF
jgi:hemolysin activation/secretion protein